MAAPRIPVRRILRLALCAALLPLLGACARDSRLLHPPEPEATAALNWRAQSEDGVKLTLISVGVRNDGASWVRDADWDEYALSIRNETALPMALRSVELSNDLLGHVPHSTAPDQLQSQSTQNVETMKTAGRVIVIGYTGVVTGFLALASAAGYVVAAPLIPIMVLTGGISAYRNQSQANAEAKVIEYELERRGLHLPASLLPGAELKRSAFFPVTPAPQQMRLRYTLGSQERELVLSLPALAQLHIQQAQN